MIKKNKGSHSQINLPSSNNQYNKRVAQISQQPRFCYQKNFSPENFQEASQRIPANKFKLDNSSCLIKDQAKKTHKFYMNSQYEETKDCRPLARQLSRQIVRDISTDNFKRDQSTTVNLWQTFGKEQTLVKKELFHTTSKPSAPVLQSSDLNREKKSSYRLKYEYRNNYLLDTKKSSYYQFIREKKELQQTHRKPMFVEDSKFKPQIQIRKVGAGSSYKFSENKHFY